LDIGVLGYIGIVQHKEHSPEVLFIPPGTPCIYIYIHTHTHICVCVCVCTVCLFAAWNKAAPAGRMFVKFCASTSY